MGCLPFYCTLETKVRATSSQTWDHMRTLYSIIEDLETKFEHQMDGLEEFITQQVVIDLGYDKKPDEKLFLCVPGCSECDEPEGWNP